nr:hypothetical protein BaRGS_021061 [Batillaria attramentaria]
MTSSASCSALRTASPFATLCAAAKHRACTEVTELQEKLKEAQAVLSDLAIKLSAGENDLERAIRKLDQHLKQTQKNAQKALADIDAACDRLKTSVETCRLRWKELVLAAKSDEEAIVYVERRGKLTSHRRLVQMDRRDTDYRSSVITGILTVDPDILPLFNHPKNQMLEKP